MRVVVISVVKGFQVRQFQVGLEGARHWVEAVDQDLEVVEASDGASLKKAVRIILQRCRLLGPTMLSWSIAKSCQGVECISGERGSAKAYFYALLEGRTMMSSMLAGLMNRIMS